MSEYVPGFETSVWTGVDAPRNTPADVVDTLNREVNAALADPENKSRLTELSGTILPRSAADFGKLIAEEAGKWAKAVKLAGVTAG